MSASPPKEPWITVLAIAAVIIAFTVVLPFAMDFLSEPEPIVEPVPTQKAHKECNMTRTYEAIDWKIKCNDGFIYDRVVVNEQTDREAEIARREEVKRQLEAKEAHDKSKADWLAKHPPVVELFDEKRIYDTEYVIKYLQKNPISGHCALVWIGDVVCVDSDAIRFPTERP